MSGERIRAAKPKTEGRSKTEMGMYEGFAANAECDDCEALYKTVQGTAEFTSAKEMLIAVLSEMEWCFTVRDDLLVVLCPTCSLGSALTAKRREG